MKFFLLIILLNLSLTIVSFGQSKDVKPKPDKATEVMKDAKITAEAGDILITISKVNVTRLPEVTIYFEAFKQNGEPIDSLRAQDLMIYEAGKQKTVLKVEKIRTTEDTPVDFIFILDKTATMQMNMNQIKDNIIDFTKKLKGANIDYRLGLILFSDVVDNIYQPISNVEQFQSWLNGVTCELGGDTKENALEAIEAGVMKIKFRDYANKIFLIVTDAPYHQVYEEGDGSSNQNTETIINLLQQHQVRLFSIVPSRLSQYLDISLKTRGSTYDITAPFSQTLSYFTGRFSNIFTMTYRSDEEAIPDSIEISLYEPETQRWIKKNVSLTSLGRKLIIENLLFSTASAALPSFVPELSLIAEFLRKKPNVSLLVEGHTDIVGTDEVNNSLSLKRAESVKNYLVAKGIDPKRIKTKGYGEKQPIASNSTEEGRRLNRRTELVILSE
jgi:outer membrane protein OmpA-like peptidoglycan-associated protein